MPSYRKLCLTAYLLKYRKSYRIIQDNSDAIVVLCEGQICELEQMLGEKSTPKTHVIYNSMPTPDMKVTKRDKNVLWVGNFDYHVKRPDNMLKIWKEVEQNCPDWKLYMLGDGPSYDCCKKMSKELGLNNVFFMGRVNPTEYYRSAEVICLTSVHECFPMVLLEGMNYGLAIVAFNSFTSANLLIEKGGNGRLVQSFNIEEYAKTLSKLLSQKEEREKLQNKAQVAANRFSEDAIYKMWKQLFDFLMIQ